MARSRFLGSADIPSHTDPRSYGWVWKVRGSRMAYRRPVAVLALISNPPRNASSDWLPAFREPADEETSGA